MRSFVFFLIFPLSVHAYTQQQKKMIADLKVGNIEGLRQGLDSGIDIDFPGPTGIRLLHRAVRYSQTRLQEALRVVAFLLEEGANPNVQVRGSGFTPLHYLFNSRYISLEILRLLIDAGADASKPDVYGGAPLHIWASHNRPHISGMKNMSDPLSLGVDIESRFTYSYHTSEGEKEILRLLVVKAGADINATDNYGFTPLLRAAESGYIYFINELGVEKLDMSARNNNGQTAFHLAVNADTLEALQSLLMKKLRFQMKVKSDSELALTLFVERFEDRVSTAVGRDKVEALFNREMTGTEMVELQESIFKMQVKDVIDMQDNFGKTVLHYKAGRGDVGSVELLLKAGADVHATDNGEMTALHDVVSSGVEQLSVVEHLVKAGANILAENENGQTPLDIARANRYEATVQFFIESLSSSEEKAIKSKRENLCGF